MNLLGKTVFFLGDSITFGTGASSPEKSYVQRFSTLFGCNAVNYGVGGTTIEPTDVKPFHNKWDDDFYRRAVRMGEGADAVVVFGGTNDYGHGSLPVGSPTDRLENTFCGAVSRLLVYLRTRYRKSVLLVTPVPRAKQNDPYGEHWRDFATAPLSGYAEAMCRTGTENGAYVLDLFTRFSGDGAFLTKYLADGLHPNDDGHDLIARLIGEKLQETEA